MNKEMESGSGYQQSGRMAAHLLGILNFGTCRSFKTMQRRGGQKALW